MTTVHYPRRLFGWTPVSPLLLSHFYTQKHTRTHTHTSFIRLSIHWIARVQLLLNCRLVVPFFAAISPLHILFVLLFLASFFSAHAEHFSFFPLALQYFSYRFWLAICMCVSSVCFHFVSFSLDSSSFHNESTNLLMILESISQIIIHSRCGRSFYTLHQVSFSFFSSIGCVRMLVLPPLVYVRVCDFQCKWIFDKGIIFSSDTFSDRPSDAHCFMNEILCWLAGWIEFNAAIFQLNSI